MIAVGTNMGVYVGVEGDANSIRQVLALSDVTQMAVLEEQHILVVLAGNVCGEGGRKEGIVF